MEWKRGQISETIVPDSRRAQLEIWAIDEDFTLLCYASHISGRRSQERNEWCCLDLASKFEWKLVVGMAWHGRVGSLEEWMV